MKLVAENSEAQLAENRAREQLTWALRDLAANVLRVTRGAGKAYTLIPEAILVIEAAVAYQKIAGTGPSAQILSDALNIELSQEIILSLSDLAVDRLHAEQTVISGALQVAASRLLQQRTQETTGHREIYEGLREINRCQSELREQQAKAATPPQERNPKKL